MFSPERHQPSQTSPPSRSVACAMPPMEKYKNLRESSHLKEAIISQAATKNSHSMRKIFNEPHITTPGTESRMQKYDLSPTYRSQSTPHQAQLAPRTNLSIPELAIQKQNNKLAALVSTSSIQSSAPIY